MPKTDITGSCLHGTAGYQQSERRRRYRAPYLIGRPCRDHERHRGGHRAGKGKRGGVQEKVKARCGARWCVKYLVPTALLAFAFSNNQRRCSEHEASSKHHKIDDDE